jgi:hypothetical protein
MVFIIGFLKIIGFILLALFLLLLFLLAVILFIPIRYQISGSGRPYEFFGKVQWLFGLIRFGFGYQDDSFQTHVWYPFKKKARTRTKVKNSPRVSNTKEEAILTDISAPPKQTTSEPVSSFVQEEKVHTKTTKEKLHKRKKKKVKKLKKEKKQFDFLSKFKTFREAISKEENKELIRFMLKQFKFLLKHVKPSQIKADIAFSTTDPALTGEILGVVSIFPFIYQKNVSIKPDFTSESTYVEGLLSCKGDLFGIHILILGIRLLANKQIRTILLNRR